MRTGAGLRPAGILAALALADALWGCGGALARAAPAEPARGADFTRSGWPLLVVVLDGLDWDWIHRFATGDGTPHLRALVLESARAAYNPLASFRDGSGAYLSAALGVRVEGSAPLRLEAGPQARGIFLRRTGLSPPEGRHLLLDLPLLSAQGAASGGFAPLGWLGGGLRRAGVRLVLLGDDRWQQGPTGEPEAALPGWAREGSPLAAAGLLAVDRRGTAPPVRVVSVPDPSAPGGLRTGWELLPELLGDEAARAGGSRRVMAVVASGDLRRRLAEAPQMAPEAREAHHRALAEALDRLAAWWQRDPFWGRGSLLLLGGTGPSTDGRDGRLLAAMLWRGPWGARALTSGTTRRDGLVVAIDLAPTLARMAGVPVPAGVVGRPLAPGGPAPGAAALRDFARSRAVIWSGRLRVMGVLITLQVLVLALGLALSLVRRLEGAGLLGSGAGGRLAAAARLAVAWTAAVPLALLVPWVADPPVAGWAGPAWSVGSAAAAAAALAWAADAAGKRLGLGATPVIAALTAAALAADLLGRLDLVARSMMGFDLIGGARLYGIGNEHAGLLIGSALIAAGEAARRWPWARWPLTAALLGLAWMVASPDLGANVGGSLAFAAAVGACAAGWHADSRPRVGAALARAAAGAAVAACLLLAAYLQDAGAPADRQSHLALTAAKAQSVGGAYVVSVAARKLALNWRLLRYSLYSRVLFVAMLVVMTAFWLPSGGPLRALKRHPALRVALEASALGAAVALVANDSGVTAAAGALLVPAAWVLERVLAGPQPGDGGGEAGRADGGGPMGAG